MNIKPKDVVVYLPGSGKLHAGSVLTNPKFTPQNSPDSSEAATEVLPAFAVRFYPALTEEKQNEISQ